MSRSDEYDSAEDSRESVASGNNGGLITQPRPQPLSPSLLAEQQRAKSEIEAALTIAANRPRDEVRALEQIRVSCGRRGVAEEAEYEYSRGGTPITGPTIRLMELIAQHWGNLEFGFRELARYPGKARQSGESVVEAFAWDLQTNTRRKVTFTVDHVIGLKNGGKKNLTDPRDIYEHIANQAQRRVRTCLENIIPRDITDMACDDCRASLKERENVTPEKIAKMVDALAAFGVTKEMLETRLQRSLETVTPAQMVKLRRIYASLRDEVATVEDFFQVPEGEERKTTAEKAKDAMRKRAGEKAATTTPPPQEAPGEPQDVPDEPAAEDPGPSPLDGWRELVDSGGDLRDVNDARKHLAEVGGDLSDEDRATISGWLDQAAKKHTPAKKAKAGSLPGME